MYLFKDILEEDFDQGWPSGWRKNPKTGLIDVDNDVTYKNPKLKKLHYKFGVVTGNFSVIGCGLETLEGAPKEIGLSFDCSYNLFTSLKYGPKIVGGSYSCRSNQLTNLEYAPKRLDNGSFDCNENDLISLKGCPQYVDGVFDIGYNKLTSLEGSPQYVGLDYCCDHNELTSLKGITQKIGRDLYLSNNKLTSPKYFPTSHLGNRDQAKSEIMHQLSLYLAGLGYKPGTDAYKQMFKIMWSGENEE